METVNPILAAAQALHIRLLYCDATVKKFEADSLQCLASFGLDASWQHLLPNTRSDGHRTEMHGRRIQAAQELSIMFGATLERLTNSRFDAVQVTDSDWFREYLSSDEFFNPRWSLAHPSGVGRAYDGYSRFFFWARRYFRLRAIDTDLMLRDDLFLDFAACLDQQQVAVRIPAWARFHGGFFWVQRPGTNGPCRGLTAERKVITASGKRSAPRLLAKGFLNLDALEP